MTGRKITVSALQPTGPLHIGNYLGAMKQFKSFEENSNCFFSVADLHALTNLPSSSELKKNTLEVAAALLCLGLTNKSTIFVQSMVPEHTELAWIFTCISRYGWLLRMTQFKDKAGSKRDGVSSGLFNYPNLMAADILIYHANFVPVGEDQLQHIEYTRNISQKFNVDYSKAIVDAGLGETYFIAPKASVSNNIHRIMSLRDGNSKMSSSNKSDYSRINLMDSSDLIAKKIKKAKSDSFALPSTIDELSNRPEAKNLLTIYAAFSDQPLEYVINQYSGKDFSCLKGELSDLIIAHLEPISSNIRLLLQDQAVILNKLEEGCAIARKTAGQTVKKVREIIGLYSSL